MAQTLYLTANGCSASAIHYNSEQNVTPYYTVSFTITVNGNTLLLTASYTTSVGFFGDGLGMGFVVEGSGSNEVITKSMEWAFGTNSSTGQYYGEYGTRTLTADISSFTFPITFYFTCSGCGFAASGGDEPYLTKWLDDDGSVATWIIYDNRHTHISKPDPPTVVSTTGTTIRLKNGEDGLYCTTTSDGWYNTPYTFTGLNQGKSYKFKCRKYCPDCPDDKVYESSTVTAKTWSISGEHVASGVSSLVFKATHIAGTNGDATAHTITYKLYNSKSTSGTVISTKTGSNGVPVTFTGLDSGKTYYCYAYTTSLGSGDNNCWIEAGVTKTETTVQSNSGDASAKTLRASVSWNAGGATSVTCTIECNGTTKTLSSSGGYVGFTGLTPGTTYTVSWRVVSTYTYSYTYTIINDSGKEEEKIGTRTETSESTGSTSLTTKKAEFVTPINVSSKIIQFKSKSNNSSDIMEQKLGSNSWSSVNQNTYKTYNNLTHNTSYTIYCRIYGCYAFNASGSQTTTNDSEISQSVSTLLLSLSASVSEEHQHSLTTLWQAYVNNVATDKDNIDDTKFEFTYMTTVAKKSNPPYQSSEVTEGNNGSTTGTYQTNKKIYSSNLTWYYCEYIVTASITDGYNVVAAAVTAHTIFPASWIYSGGTWHRYMPHIYTGSKWVPAPVFIYKNNKYTEPNGE